MEVYHVYWTCCKIVNILIEKYVILSSLVSSGCRQQWHRLHYSCNDSNEDDVGGKKGFAQVSTAFTFICGYHHDHAK